MANFLRMVVGVLMVPACWGMTRALIDAIVVAAGARCGFGWSALAFLGGMVAFAFGWMALPHPVKAYVIGHELTHALWGLLFGALPSGLRVGARGGSVRLTKTNVFITLAPYFFPFYTFLVTVLALIVWAFARTLPWLPLWMFLIGLTWAFHLLFTIETLTQRQPDVTLYGRIFSWTFIYCANLLLVLVWLAALTPLTFAHAGGMLLMRLGAAYAAVGWALSSLFSWLGGLIARS
ncbi:MAG: hypothetical protein ACI4R9_03175 [Kiritimatiellia bacterium]